MLVAGTFQATTAGVAFSTSPQIAGARLAHNPSPKQKNRRVQEFPGRGKLAWRVPNSSDLRGLAAIRTDTAFIVKSGA
jgi:hypothetical protein